MHEYKGCTKDHVWLKCMGHYRAHPSTILFYSILFELPCIIKTVEMYVGIPSVPVL